MVAAANALTPDLVAITGDLVDGSVENLRAHTEPLARLKGPEGRYFVTGNHEYYSGADDWIAEVGRLGIPTLRNDAVRLKRRGASLLIAGVTDHRAAEFGDGPDLARALRRRRPAEEVVLLAHQPREISEAEKHNVGLQISGHTHGGQFWPWNWAVYLVQPVVAGLARFGRTQIYVNSGTGYWGPPMRLGTQSEITLITLRSPHAAATLSAALSA
jgi:predicted MPP superfamily phosphohydrolase